MNYKTSFSTRLRDKLQLACGPEESNIDLQLKEKAQAWFRNYIVTTHSIIRSSVPLMEAAHERSKTTDLTEEGKLMAELRRYYKKHSQEEMNHDEWLLDDLESIGVSRQESLSRKPSQAVAELVGSQYYWIFHWHPICLLGYISYLEGNPPKMELISQLQRITKYPETAFRTLVKHSDLDPHHRDDLNELLEGLPLTAEHEQWITFNALYSAKKLREIRTLENLIFLEMIYFLLTTRKS